MPSRLRRLVPLLLAAALLSVLALRAPDLAPRLARRDFPAYWAAGRLLLLHQDPYSPTAFLASQGFSVSPALVARNPPWTLPLFLPLGLLAPFPAWMLWTAASLAALLFALHDTQPHPRRLRLLGYLFPPVLCCLAVAQTGLVMLAGFVCVLRLLPRRPVLAGAALLLPFAKPHLLAPFWIALLLWCLLNRRWSPLAGLASALTLSSACALAFDPADFAHYAACMGRAAIARDFIPSLPGVLRALFFKPYFQLQFLPLSIALIWSVWYTLRHRALWNWRIHGHTLAAVSLAVSPYAWFTDEALLLPAVLQAAAWIFAARALRTARLAIALFALAWALLLLMVLSQVPPAAGLYFWSTLVWLLWYLYGLRRSRAPL